MIQREPVFLEPWHAQVFALTVHLNEAGLFDWPDWTAAFSDTLARHGLEKELDGGDDYFIAWLETIEKVIIRAGVADAAEMEALRSAWEAAYLNTPHGLPVKLAP
ncbi:MAG: nitrile hydratase accessory protein [Roseobacter sp.]